MYLEIENSILEKAALGDVNCFEKIVTIYEKMIYNVCYRYFNNEEDAKDVSQEVFIKIFRNLKKYNFTCKFSTWAYKIAVNSCLDQLRKKKSRPVTSEIDDEIFQLSDASQCPSDALLSKEMLNNLENAIKKLPDEYKTFIILRDINGLSYNEISEITETNLGTVKSRISRARSYLKNILITDFEINI